MNSYIKVEKYVAVMIGLAIMFVVMATMIMERKRMTNTVYKILKKEGLLNLMTEKDKNEILSAIETNQVMTLTNWNEIDRLAAPRIRRIDYAE